MYLDFGVKNSTLDQWEAIPGIIKNIFGGGKSQAQKKAESVSRREGRAGNIINALPSLAQVPKLQAELYSFLRNCMGQGTCPDSGPLAQMIVSRYPRETGVEFMRMSPTVMEKRGGYHFITKLQESLRPMLSSMKPLSEFLGPPTQVITPTPPSRPVYIPPTVRPPTLTTEITPWPTREFPWTTPPIVSPATQAPIIVTAPGQAPIMKAGLGIDPQTLLIGGGVALGAILLSQGGKRRR